MDEGGSLLTVTYLDTSALMRLVTREGEFSIVRDTLRRSSTTSKLTELELAAAVYQRWRAGVINETERGVLLATVRNDILPAATFVAIDEEVLREAGDMVADYSVRSLDAIHLATAVIAARHARRHGARLRFCTADRRQAAAAYSIFGASEVAFVPPPA